MKFIFAGTAPAAELAHRANSTGDKKLVLGKSGRRIQNCVERFIVGAGADDSDAEPVILLSRLVHGEVRDAIFENHSRRTPGRYLGANWFVWSSA